MEYPCYDLFGKQSMADSSWNIRVWPITCNILNYLRGHSRALHWCYKIVDSTLIFHFSLAFGLGRSTNPPGPIFAVALFDNSFYAAPILRAHLLYCVGVSSLLLAAIWLLKNLGFFPSAPLFTLPRRVCIFRLDTINVSIVEGILCFRHLVLVGDKGRVYDSSARGYQSICGGCTSFKRASKL